MSETGARSSGGAMPARRLPCGREWRRAVRQHERSGGSDQQSPGNAEAPATEQRESIEHRLLQPAMRGPFMRRLAQRRASRASAPAAAAPAPQVSQELSHMYFFDDEEAGEIRTQPNDAMPGGGTWKDQLLAMQK